MVVPCPFLQGMEQTWSLHPCIPGMNPKAPPKQQLAQATAPPEPLIPAGPDAVGRAWEKPYESPGDHAAGQV